MPSSHNPDSLVVASDDDHAVANAGWCYPPRSRSGWAACSAADADPPASRERQTKVR
jgi:hypothetical protein